MTTFGYDSNGNMTKVTYPTGAPTTYTWDSRNRMSKIMKAGLTSSITLTSDPDNLLIGRQSSSGSEGLMRDRLTGEVVSWNRSASGSMGAAQVYPGGPGISRAFGQSGAGAGMSRQYHTKAHGDVIATSDAGQTLETAYQFDAFGNVLSGSA